MRKFIGLLICIFFLISCEKETGSGIEVYILKDYETVPGSKEIVSGSETIEKAPFIYYNQINYYDSIDCFFNLSADKAEELNRTNWPTEGKAFSLTLDKSVIYSGYFIPGYSSSGCDWITIEPLNVDSNIHIYLGYPGNQSNHIENDPRNDKRIINYLIKDGKLR
jgi:hypothetical protein